MKNKCSKHSLTGIILKAIKDVIETTGEILLWTVYQTMVCVNDKYPEFNNHIVYLEEYLLFQEIDT